jgi:hypothetical protein
MKTSLIVVLTLCLAAQSSPRENIIHLKSCEVKLSQDWIIMNHIPNGMDISLISVILPDSNGQPREDKSLLQYGYIDVSGHAGLTKMQLITDNPNRKKVKGIDGWDVSYIVEAKKSDYALLIDAFRYIEDRKAYLWVRRGRMVKDAAFQPTDDDYKEFAPYLEKISIDKGA